MVLVARASTVKSKKKSSVNPPPLSSPHSYSNCVWKRAIYAPKSRFRSKMKVLCLMPASSGGSEEEEEDEVECVDGEGGGDDDDGDSATVMWFEGTIRDVSCGYAKVSFKGLNKKQDEWVELGEDVRVDGGEIEGGGKGKRWRDGGKK